MAEKQDNKGATIMIPKPLAEKLRGMLKDSGFSSLSEYITYILEETISDIEKEDKPSFSKEEEEKVKKRLRDLGYL
ncbi:MAG: CopG family transcriptional regulator [Candidatus Aenigmatarchaeota archaeon]